MVADCLAGDRRLLVARLQPGWERDYEGRPPLCAVGGVGEIIQAERLPDGRFNILLDGRMRARILTEEPAGDTPYRVARARRLVDGGPAAGAAALREDLAGLRAAHEKLLEALGQTHADVVGRLTVAGSGPGAVVDRIVSAVVPDAAVRQRVLEAVDVRERLDLAARALADLLALVAGGPGEDGADDAGDG